LPGDADVDPDGRVGVADSFAIQVRYRDLEVRRQLLGVIRGPLSGGCTPTWSGGLSGPRTAVGGFCGLAKRPAEVV
jgi:hypothetical protein